MVNITAGVREAKSAISEMKEGRWKGGVRGREWK
jgi:hypothetical protein